MAAKGGRTSKAGKRDLERARGLSGEAERTVAVYDPTHIAYDPRKVVDIHQLNPRARKMLGMDPFPRMKQQVHGRTRKAAAEEAA